MAKQLMQNKYRPDIDGLRAIAVALVIGYHYFPNFIQSGFIGVDIFFVISGYLITQIIAHRINIDKFSYQEFYKRRVNRIFPALLTLLTITIVLSWYTLVANELNAIGKHISASSIFLSNIALWSESGYFGTSADTKPLLHLWSLAIEEQFYIVWPILLAWAAKGQRRGLLFIALTIATSFAYSVYVALSDSTAAYYSPASRGWQLATGGFIAYAEHQDFKGSYYRKVWQGLIGLTFIALGCIFIERSKNYPGWWALLPTIGAALLISAGSHAWPNRTILSLKPLVLMGLISYPLYLWHWALLVWAKLIYMTSNLPPSLRITLVALSFILAWLTYLFIESPIRRRNSFSTAYPLAIAMCVTGFIGLFFWSGLLPGRISSEGLNKIVAATKDWDYPSEGFRAYKRFSDYTFYRNDGNNRNITLFIGDSNMEQYAPRISYVIKQNQYSQGAIMATKGGCPFSIPALAQKQPDCKDKLDAIDEIINSNEVHTIVFSQAWLNLEKMVKDPVLLASFEERLSSIPSGKRIYIILNMPSGIDFSPTSLIHGSRLTNLDFDEKGKLYVDEALAKSKFSQLNELIKKIANQHQATVIDPFETICKSQQCWLIDKNGSPMYKDSAHLTASYVRQAATFVDISLSPR